MNKVVTTALGAIFGAAIGGGIAYWYLNTKYSKVIDIECASYQDEITTLRTQVKDLQKRVITKLDEAKESIAKGEPTEIDPNQLTIDDISDNSDDEEDIDIEPTSRDDLGKIRYIGAKDYEDDDDYEKEVFNYYAGDGVFTQDDEILEEEEVVEVCGKDALNKIRNWRRMDDVKEIYVRNEDYNTDYKIKKYNITYQKYINGLNN